MSRPKKKRMVNCPPVFSSFKPAGVRRNQLVQVSLLLDEYEAIKLVDYEGMDHQEASEEMGVSRPTISRLIDKARKKIVLLLVEGKELIIEGGDVHFKENFLECLDCGHKFKINISNDVNECPSCKSKNLLDFAGRFGHGRCCDQHKNRKGK
ncbi:MAG: DNA-binding protein [Candidatus Cloacimonetes bacterium 4572_65]|nr:MAG: DNA-binding protein [Candidatus Cloacimonetes bacterium 4572_65]